MLCAGYYMHSTTMMSMVLSPWQGILEYLAREQGSFDRFMGSDKNIDFWYLSGTLSL